MEGWVKLHRCLMEKSIWLQSTPEQKAILITLLSLANHKEKQWEWGGQKFEAKAGQFVSSADSIIKACGKGVSRQNVRSALTRFKKLEFLTIKSTKQGMLVTIVNWGVYQSFESEPNQAINQDLTNDQPTGNQDLTTNNNVRKKECKNDKNIYSENLELNQAIMGFIEMRKSLKKPMTTRAINMMLKKLNGLSNDDAIKIEILNQSIMCSWTDIYELKQQKLFNSQQPTKKSKADQDMEELGRMMADYDRCNAKQDNKSVSCQLPRL